MLRSTELNKLGMTDTVYRDLLCRATVGSLSIDEGISRIRPKAHFAETLDLHIKQKKCIMCAVIRHLFYLGLSPLEFSQKLV